jgi:acyl-CoA thioester hydrolase
VNEKRIEIRWRDMDAYNHVNNAVYLTYLEEVRDDWLTGLMGARGVPIDYVVVHIGLDFKRELSQKDEEVIVRCRLEKLGNSSIHTFEEIATPDGQTAAQARAVLVVRDQKTGRSRPITDAEKQVLQETG